MKGPRLRVKADLYKSCKGRKPRRKALAFSRPPPLVFLHEIMGSRHVVRNGWNRWL